jgi:hypothetical protein
MSLAPERGRAIAAIAGAHENSNPVKEHRGDRRTPMVASRRRSTPG